MKRRVAFKIWLHRVFEALFPPAGPGTYLRRCPTCGGSKFRTLPSYPDGEMFCEKCDRSLLRRKP